MTAEHREELLESLVKEIKALSEKVDAIEEALFKVPKGAPPSEGPLIAEVRALITAWKRASWGIRAILWIMTALSVIGGGVAAMASFLSKFRI